MQTTMARSTLFLLVSLLNQETGSSFDHQSFHRLD
ncbi:hypothetical protein AHA_0911 [Aeromonas hydrophila subsp. hydrophila ATCC 7966]|uniref:Uncharacterized protein n=1 Tax=Aeromonas hydrophila subsp. hydrophila (strain ATCC 7966 / DSM 30187 / BCRC 13018 / CCUG 14551 / JCM 1027 / KCTC 2358 / NCIMB 9240 / NCTC 8049) TaxID=380703 RepID=A0KGQ8_AERHH|nr:hypothetical protein AHA_0911 [Aeromonas hydrophila subsp. hydrophila ATCC 7966]MBW3831409.1 hypothetical protein [Aeromonas hydrophila]MBW5265689.1 hypothetical protein [Aeromonas hydrophila]MBW5276128.1 hypothetical protein [Aeromonas hydrophila]